MKGNAAEPATIDEYLAQFTGDVRARLERMRALIRAAAPEAIEKISYRMPTFFLHGNLVHFAGYAGHVGLYPAPSGVAAFAAELSEYVWAKGSIQLPHDRPIPAALVTKITKFRVAENLAKAAGRAKPAAGRGKAAGRAKPAAGSGSAAGRAKPAAGSGRAAGRAKPAGKLTVAAKASLAGKARPAAATASLAGKARPAAATASLAGKARSAAATASLAGKARSAAAKAKPVAGNATPTSSTGSRASATRRTSGTASSGERLGAEGRGRGR